MAINKSKPAIRSVMSLAAAAVLVLAACTAVPGPLEQAAPAQTAANVADSAVQKPLQQPEPKTEPQTEPQTESQPERLEQPKSADTAPPSAAAQQSKPPVSAPSAEPEMQAPPPAALVAAEAATAAEPKPVPAPSPQKSTVQVGIIGDDKKGTILAFTIVDMQDGDTVIDVLRRITKEKKIQMETRGSGKSVYVEGIANLYEFDRGGKSGWLYRVNGTFPNVGAGDYSLTMGDKIEWLYTVDLGKDVGKTGEAGSK